MFEVWAMRLKRCRQWLFYLLLRIAICIVQSLPIAVCERLAFFASWMVADRLQLRGSVIDENLAMAFPHLGPVERRDLTRRMWCHIVLMIFELAHLPRKIHRTNWRRHIRFESEESQSAYFLDPRPLIVLSGHFGNFEVGGVLTGLMGFPTYSVARPLDNPFLNRLVSSGDGTIHFAKDGKFTTCRSHPAGWRNAGVAGGSIGRSERLLGRVFWSACVMSQGRCAVFFDIPSTLVALLRPTRGEAATISVGRGR